MFMHPHDVMSAPKTSLALYQRKARAFLLKKQNSMTSFSRRGFCRSLARGGVRANATACNDVRAVMKDLPDTKVGTFTQTLYDGAEAKRWIVISMKKDWRRIFAFET